MTEKLTILRSAAAPLLRDNIDTDVIVRVERLFGAVPRAELGRYGFETWRYRPDGSDDPAFPPNHPAYRTAQILLGGANFGCGSAREGAVWALAGMGYRCIIAPSFGDIFVTNCFQNGLLPIVIDRARIAELAAQGAADQAGAIVTVDLEAERVVAPDGTAIAFHIPALRRAALMQGLEDIALTLKRGADIAAFQARDAIARPWIYRLENAPRGLTQA